MSVKSRDNLPRLLRRFGVIDKVQVVIGDYALVGKELKTNHLVPVRFPKKNDGDFLHAIGLPKRQSIEQFVQRSKTAGKNDEGFGAQQEMHLAQREIMELET